VRDEDLDWEIYHALVEGKARTTRELSAAGYDPSLVEASLGRLERSHLIERTGEAVRPLSFQEAILLCRLKNETDCPFVIENGTIRVKTEEGRKG
jgi:hypothetical protein